MQSRAHFRWLHDGMNRVRTAAPQESHGLRRHAVGVRMKRANTSWLIVVATIGVSVALTIGLGRGQVGSTGETLLAVVDTSGHVLKSVDLGIVQTSTNVTRTITLKNVSDTPLRLESVGSDCGCTVARFAPGEVSPGRFTEISVTYSATGGAGDFHRLITLKTNKGQQTIEVGGTVRDKMLVAFPDRLVLTATRGDRAINGKLFLWGRPSAVGKIPSIITMNMREPRRLTIGRVDEETTASPNSLVPVLITLELPDSASADRISQAIVIGLATDKGLSELQIPVTIDFVSNVK